MADVPEPRDAPTPDGVYAAHEGEPRGFSRASAGARTVELEAIVATALDYYLGWLDGDADRLAGSLHPDARKRAVVDHATGALALDELDIPPWLERIRVREAIELPRDPEVVVLDVHRDIATALVLSQPYMDYLHLARFGDRWLIVNVLYEER